MSELLVKVGEWSDGNGGRTTVILGCGNYLSSNIISLIVSNLQITIPGVASLFA
jgi:hypothetical protein